LKEVNVISGGFKALQDLLKKYQMKKMVQTGIKHTIYD